MGSTNKAVVKLVLPDCKSQKAVRKALVELEGFRSCTLDYEKSTLVVLGDIDPTSMVFKLRKYVKANLETFGPEKNKGSGDGGGNVVRPQQQQQQPVLPPTHVHDQYYPYYRQHY